VTVIHELPLNSITSEETTLGEYAGSVLLVVNVASQCGLTGQYEGLERLYEKYRDRGFAVLGFPSNDFGSQEPGTNEEIAAFCSTTYSVAFPMFAKIRVGGEDQHPLYRELTAAAPRAEGDPDSFRDVLRGHGMTPSEDPDVLWNFEKFLLGRDGRVVKRFAPTMTPDDPSITTAIESELAK
jgi:glutathione peroxidase